MTTTDPSRPYAQCSACNCVPGFCAQAEYLRQVEIDALIRKALSDVGTHAANSPEAAPLTVITSGNSPMDPLVSAGLGQPLRKNRRQRRMEEHLRKNGPPAKRRR